MTNARDYLNCLLPNDRKRAIDEANAIMERKWSAAFNKEVLKHMSVLIEHGSIVINAMPIESVVTFDTQLNASESIKYERIQVDYDYTLPDLEAYEKAREAVEAVIRRVMKPPKRVSY